MRSAGLVLQSLPAMDGFRMPGEFEAHERSWLVWPERPDIWRERALRAQQPFAMLAAAIARFEPVTVGASPGPFAFARGALLPQIRVVPLPNDDAWVRDTGPTFVVNAAGRRRGVDWRFNAWGGLYSSWARDDAVARRVLAIQRCSRYRAPMINEGGAIHTDGEGTLLVTEQCLLNPNRNRGLSLFRIEQLLRSYLGVEPIIWLAPVSINDETGGTRAKLPSSPLPRAVGLARAHNPRPPHEPASSDRL